MSQHLLVMHLLQYLHMLQYLLLPQPPMFQHIPQLLPPMFQPHLHLPLHQDTTTQCQLIH